MPRGSFSAANHLSGFAASAAAAASSARVSLRPPVTARQSKKSFVRRRSTDARRFSKSEVHLQDRKVLDRVLNLSTFFGVF